MRFLPILCLLALPARADVSLKQIMQDPDWIGPPVEAAWWQFGADGYSYSVKRSGTTVRDHYRMFAADATVDLVSAEERASSDGARQQFSRDGRRVLSILEGGLMLRDRGTGELKQLYAGVDAVESARFSADESEALFFAGVGWWRVALDGGAARPVADLRFAEIPHKPGDDALEQEQLRLFSTLERTRSQDEDLFDERRALAAAGLGTAPWYLGAGKEWITSELSADARFLLLAVRDEGTGSAVGDNGQADKMPHYVARSGYVDIEDVRRLVGRDDPRAEELWLLDLATREKRVIDQTRLSGIHDDPLAKLKRAQGMTPHGEDDPRPVTVNAVRWHSQRPIALVQLRSVDNKDRWILRLDGETGEWREIYRQSDEAWINPYQFTALGWLPGSDTAWLLSEADGYGHLYTIDARGRERQHTRGEYEVVHAQFSRDGSTAWLLTNRSHPTEYDIDQLAMESGEILRLTEQRGIEDFSLHPDEDRLLLRFSGSYLPAQAGVFDLASQSLGMTTETRGEAYAGLTWQAPRYEAVPSRHSDDPIWTKFYPAQGDHEGPRPVVVFVHGAGYTQNTHHKFPYYFREQMFHNLLSERGYHVIDMDYRASRGYGRDWRTAIYRQMGTPELEDLIDGVRWVVSEHNGDPDRVGVYGGSYGGFMTFMAMFNAPDVFAAGASLRPVTDWRHYNHGYTSNILNTPAVDPEAHRVSSPIEFVEGLKGHLLISHGMLDDNVFYKDSIRLVQRLIELEKENWELASYPLEPHGYIHPESWLDQYRRILKLFESTIGDKKPGTDHDS